MLADLDSQVTTSFYWYLATLSCVGGFLFGYDTSVIGSVLGFLPYDLASFETSYLVAGASIGRDYDDIEKTVMYPMEIAATGSNAGQILDELAELATLGISHAHCRIKDVTTLRPLELIGDRIIPAVVDL